LLLAVCTAEILAVVDAGSDAFSEDRTPPASAAVLTGARLARLNGRSDFGQKFRTKGELVDAFDCCLFLMDARSALRVVFLLILERLDTAGAAFRSLTEAIDIPRIRKNPLGPP
jgi:hypothetical protein